ncbi:hypothetical protein T190820D02B_70101 [Tenacibaculum sp. 190524A05c]
MTFTKNNFRSPHIYVFWGLFLLLDLGLIAYYFITENTELLYIIGMISLLLVVLYTIGFTSKITIDSQGIAYNSLFKSCRMRWKDVETIEVYRINKYFLSIEKPENYNKFSLLGQKFIYFSTKEKYIPSKTEKVSSEYINLHWRKEAWDLVLKYSDIKR